MTIDKKFYRQAYKLYRLWNEAELIELFHQRGRFSSHELFRQYAELWSFARGASPKSSPVLDLLRMAELED